MTKIKKRSKKQQEIDGRVLKTIYTTATDVLKDVLETEVKKKNDKGEDVIDVVMTLSSMRMKARFAIDFLGKLKSEFENKENQK